MVFVVKGVATASAGAFLTSLSNRARELSDKEEEPVIAIDTETRHAETLAL